MAILSIFRILLRKAAIYGTIVLDKTPARAINTPGLGRNLVARF